MEESALDLLLKTAGHIPHPATVASHVSRLP
jgi:hypothetical protein